MQVVKYILMVLYIIDCLGLIIVTMMQNSDSRGASGTIVGSSSNNFYEKNKGRTREGKLKRWTIILGVAFVVLAVALGIAKARDLKRQNYNVLAVIGDGAMTGGLAYEALNNACKSNTKMVIILNDNQMSISPNVGAMSQYLSNLRTTQKYLNAKDDIQHKLNSMPVIGKPIYNFLDKTKNTVKHTIMPNNVFEALGIRYIGPVDGHDITQLVHVFNRIKNLKGPVLIHVMTKKGKG